MVIPAEWQGLLSAWQYRDFRLLWACTLGVYIAQWIEIVVASWLVLILTDSPFLVGVLGACRFIAMFFGPFCGTIADRYNRRHILLAVQFTLATASIVMMAFFFASLLKAWHLFVFTLVASFGFTLNFSTLYATGSDIVKSRHLVSAISLLMLATGATAVFGPLLGGSLFGIIGGGGCYGLMAVASLGSLLMLLPMKVGASDRTKQNGSVWQNLVAGLSYIRNDEALLALIMLAALANLLILPYRYTLIPLFARDVFHTGANGFGYLLAAVGLGVTIGSFATGALPRAMNKGRFLITISIIWPALLIILAASRQLPLSVGFLVVAGVAQGISMALIQSLLLIWCSAEMRGRVSGVRAFAISTLPFGNIIMGAGAKLWDAPTTLAIVCVASIMITVLIAFWATQLRNRGKTAPLTRR